MSPVGLPGSLFDTYARYKLGTTAIIRWLSEQVEGTKERTYVNSVGDLRHLANMVTMKHIKAPAGVLQDLQDTIHARMEVSNFFKSLAEPGEREISSSHEHFTGILIQIHGDLRRLAKEFQIAPATSDKGINRSRSAKIPRALPKTLSNVFECLNCDECIYSEDDEFNAEQRSVETHKRREYSHISASKGTERDGIGDFMALAMYLSVSRSWDRLKRKLTCVWKAIR